MITALIATIFILFFLIIIVSLFRRDYQPMWDDEEEIVTTTTTTTTTTHVDTPAAPQVDDTIYVVGNIKREFEGKQVFVVDPVDGEKCWLNTKDDLYEDAEGKIWRVV